MTDVNSFTMPSDPVARKKIKDIIYEMSGILQQIEDSNSAKKDLATALKDEYGISVKTSNKMAKVLHKNNYSDEVASADEFTTAFETLFQGSASSTTSTED